MNITANKTDSSASRYHRIVVKFGTSLLTGGRGYLDRDIMSNLVTQVAKLQSQGLELVIVSSGAIASGKHKLGITRELKGIPLKQVLASMGQSRLMYLYEQLFSQYNINVAQALLTKTDLSDRAGYLNARNTLTALLELGVMCIVNENDVVAVDEIDEAKFGDNDNLSAMVANLIDADILLMLTDTAGLYSADPRSNDDARLIKQVKRVNYEIEKLASGTTHSMGVGGMITKIEAAKMATSSGVNVIVADGREHDIIIKLVSGESIGTHFLPTNSKLDSRKRWMLSGLYTKGKLIVDSGAATALRSQNGSLLAAGITDTIGKFKRGDIIDIYDSNDINIGCGIANYSSKDIDLIKGTHSGKIATLIGFDYGPEVVHRNNLVLV